MGKSTREAIAKTFLSYELAAKIIVVMAIAFFGMRLSAKTNAGATLEQLKTNAENSDYNYKQYQDNLDIVNKNIEQSDKAAKELRALKKQLESNTKNVAKNKKSLADMQVEILKMKASEQDRIAKDEKQIDEVKKIMSKLEANKAKRLENIAAYDQMNVQVQEELKDWDTQVQQMTVLQKELDSKEKKAVDEKSNWLSKRKDYTAEAKKWAAQSQKSKETYNKYKKVKD